jgi:hypothetical protein
MYLHPVNEMASCIGIRLLKYFSSSITDMLGNGKLLLDFANM